MHKRTRWFSCTAILSVASLGRAAQDQAPARPLTSVGPILSQDSMNVFRRFAAEPKAMYEFYGDVLGLKQLTTFDVGRNTNVARFQAGDSQLKLTTKVPNRQYHPGGVAEATGVRLITLYFPDQKAMAERFRAHGLPVPEFQPIAGSNRSHALVKDPDGQFVELLIVPNAPAEVYRQIEVGLTVSDLAASRKFYREFVGLEELPRRTIPCYTSRSIPSVTEPRPSICSASGSRFPQTPAAAGSNTWFRTPKPWMRWPKPGRSPLKPRSARSRASRLHRLA